MTPGASRARALHPSTLFALAVAALAVIVFLPALGNDFVDWDDEINLTANPHYRGLGWTQLRWMATSSHVLGHWIPLTWLSFGIDYVLWGMNPVGYHLTNMLLHAANAALFTLLSFRLLRLAMPGVGETHARLGAAVGALFWALHPLRVESVAWATERRDVLAGLFFLLSVLAYLRMVAAPAERRRRWLGASLAAFAAALLSKPIVMTLPLVLLVLDVYPLRRLGTRPSQWLAAPARRVWLEKIPYVALAALGGAISLAITASLIPMVSVGVYPLTARLAMLANSLVFYVGKTLLPVGLVPVHEAPLHMSLAASWFLGAAVLAVAITAALVALRRRFPGALAAWTIYVIMLLPVSNLIINIDPQIVADRYSYLSCLGWAVLAGAAVAALGEAAARSTIRRGISTAVAGAVAVWLVAFAALTWQQTQVWRDSTTLWTHAVTASPECALCENRLGAILFNQRQHGPAVMHLQRAVALRPDRRQHHAELGIALLWSNRPADAIPSLRLALERAPADLGLRSSLGLAYLWAGRAPEAEIEFRNVVARRPDHPDGLAGLGMTLVALERPAESIEPLERAVALRPRAPLARYGLARAYLALGRRDAAEAQVAVLKTLEPALAEQALRR
jgi:tetratricopeptide (TPR) repeat protein